MFIENLFDLNNNQIEVHREVSLIRVEDPFVKIDLAELILKQEMAKTTSITIDKLVITC